MSLREVDADPPDLRSRLWDALVTGREPGLAGQDVPADLIVSVLTAAPPAGAPVLRLYGVRVTGAVQLTGARVPVPVEFRECVFAHEPDLRMAELIGLVLTGCELPGLRANNLRVTGDLTLNDGFVAHGRIHLSDAAIGGSLRLSGSRLHGERGRALIADRLVVGGTLYARRMRSDGELRIPGARITGNIDFGGAELASPNGDALDATGIIVGGTMSAGRHRPGAEQVFTANGRVLLAGARIGGDLIFSGARLTRADGAPALAAVAVPDPTAVETRVPLIPRGIIDAAPCLVADRIHVEGNLELDDGARATGTVRFPNAVVGGYLRLSGALLTGPQGATDRCAALLGDGMDVGGDLEGRDNGRGPLRCTGQLRLVDARVRGSASLTGVELSAPGGNALLADRLRVGGEFYLRRLRCAGTLRLQNAEIGSTLDLTGAQLTDPRLHPDGKLRPSLDARAATIGKDLLLLDIRASGGIRIRRVDARKSVQCDGVLGEPAGSGSGSTVPYALNAYGLTTAELVLTPAVPPLGRVRLEQARVGAFADSAALWLAAGGLALDGFDYATLANPREPGVAVRLQRLADTVDDYVPGPYEQLAAVYRRGGDEESAEQVLMTRQRRRYAESGPAGRVWGGLQRVTVGFGYRPWLAVCWLALFWLLGGTWFAFHQPAPVDSGQNPVWNPWLFAADTLLPIVNLGQDGYWRLAGNSQWIASGLIAVGWILATTAAAGAARVLKRA